MRNLRTMLAVVMSIMLFAGFANADNTNIGIDNEVNVDANGGDASSNQNQGQEQGQHQGQVNNNVALRELITAPAGPAGNFVSGVAVAAGVCAPLYGEGLYKSFTTKRISKMADSGGMLEGKGGWFHSLFTDDINAVSYISFNGKPDDRPISLINWEPIGNNVYPEDEIIGEINCTGDYGWPMGSVLGKCLAKAKETTNTTRVFVCVSMRNDQKSSGFSVGSGGAASKMMGPAAAGGVALAGLIGTTTSFADSAFDVKVIALNDGRTEWESRRTTYVPVKPETPVVKTPPAKSSCDPSGILAEISMWWAKCQLCKFFCYNNLNIRYNLAKLNIDLYTCTGDLEALKTAQTHLIWAVDNYEQGTDTRSGKFHAQSKEMYKDSIYLLAGVYHVRGESKNERSIVKKHHLERYPKSFAR